MSPTSGQESRSPGGELSAPLRRLLLPTVLLPAPSTRSPLIGWASASARCNWPEVPSGWGQETYLSGSAREILCVRRLQLAEVVGQQWPARHRSRYVGAWGRAPRERRLAGTAVSGAPGASLRAGPPEASERRSSRAVAAGLTLRRPRSRWGSDPTAKTPVKGERTRVHPLPERTAGGAGVVGVAASGSGPRRDLASGLVVAE